MAEKIDKDIVVRVSDVVRSFGSGDRAVHVLRELSLEVETGSMIALYGPSGSGKTTLLNLIGALDYPNNGDIEVCGENILKMSERKRARLRRQKMGFIFQNYTLLPTYTALENVDLSLRLPGIRYFERRRRSNSALEVMGLSAWSDHVPDQLSGGQQQRVAIARALALQPELILADEPTSGLDTRTARRVLGLFQGIARSQGTSFLIVSHDPMVANYVDLTFDLHEGKLAKRLKYEEQVDDDLATG